MRNLFKDIYTWRNFLFLFVLFGCATSYNGMGELRGPSGGSRSVTLEGTTYDTNPDGSPPDFDWPVLEGRMTRGFLVKTRRGHYGLDLAAYKGARVVASAAGYVVFAGRGFRGYGNLVVIEHSEAWATLYAHLDKISVREGDKVDSGQEIGKMGRTGNARGVHLHFEIRHHRVPVNPLAYLPEGFGIPKQANLQ